jgi:diguanylate cyclase (GGDEF)-like protein
MVSWSTASQPAKADFASQEYFKVHRERADTGLFIGALPDRDPSIALSRRLSRPDGTFGGVIVGLVRLSSFTANFDKLNLGSAGTVALLRSDGQMIMRLPFQDSDTGRDLSGSPIFRGYTEFDSGTLIGTATLDGIERLFAFRHLPGLPLILSVGVAVDDVDGTWWHKALGIGTILTLLCGATLVLCLLLARETRRRMVAETGLRGASLQLAMTSATDGLTGLMNRATFEERLTREWSRSVRAGTPIALLMLDADLFKEYTGRYGHAEGDKVLRSIAACIQRNVLRPSDTSARYDGTTFAVVLPETEARGAEVVAERIRNAVAALAIPHAASPAGHITLSAGVAIGHPAVGGDARAALVARTEAALSEAKGAKRNQFGATGSAGVAVAT